MSTTLIQNGLIVDGTGALAFHGDILFDEKILEIAPHIGADKADHVVDAKGLVVSPGFIDPHSHADLSVIEDKAQRFMIEQGVTTECIGLCGLGYVPLPRDLMIQNLRFGAGLFGYRPEYDNYDFSSFTSYMRYADHTACNVAVNATHNAARIAAAGFTDDAVEPSVRNERMQQIIRDAMDQGCVGFSTGLSYYPCAYADYEELKALALAIKEKDGTFLMHIRYPKPDQPYGAIEEITRLGIETGCRIHILHYRTKYHLDGGHPEILLGMIREANEKGADISMETLPYLSGSTYIHAILPGWVMEGGREQTLARLADPANRDRIKEEMQYLKNITVMGNGKPTRFGHVGGHPELSGRFILDIARERQQEVDDLLIDLMIESGLDINYVGNERDEDPEMVRVMMDDTMTLLMDPLYLVGSDAMPYGEYQHPRTYGCYPRMLRLARERNIPLEQMVNKITMMPARRLRLAGKGELAPGMAADIVIFDPETIADADDFDDPYKRPTGIQSVYVNGERTVENGVYNGALNGTLVHKE